MQIWSRPWRDLTHAQQQYYDVTVEIFDALYTSVPVAAARCFDQIKAVLLLPLTHSKLTHVQLAPTMSDFGSYSGGSMVRASGSCFLL